MKTKLLTDFQICIGVPLMTREAVSFEKVFHRTKFLALESQKPLFNEAFHESLEKQFSWNLM